MSPNDAWFVLGLMAAAAAASGFCFGFLVGASRAALQRPSGVMKLPGPW